MARTWPGGGADPDKLTVTRYAAIDNLAALSIGLWVYQTGLGGGSNGRLVQKNLTGWDTFTATGEWHFAARRWSTTAGDWHIVAPSSSAWHHLLWTYSYSALGNVPVAYVDGLPKTVTTLTAPAGTATGDDSALHVVIGNYTDGRAWAGRLAEVAIWNRILTADEARYLTALPPNAPQDSGALGTGLVLYLPIGGTLSPEPNLAQPANPGVVTGTTPVASPALFTPGAAAAWNEIIEGSYTARQLLRGVAASLLGKVSGAGAGAPTFRDTTDAKNRIVGTTDGSGNRTAVTLDLT